MKTCIEKEKELVKFLVVDPGKKPSELHYNLLWLETTSTAPHSVSRNS